MASGKRRRGKFGSRSNTPPPPKASTPASSTASAAAAAASEEATQQTSSSDSKDSANRNLVKATSKTKGKASNNNNDNKTDATSTENETTTTTTKEMTSTKNPQNAKNSNNAHDLVLTSEKRRGVYECDYCHSDISQLPRIRCAVCLDFDLCLDCFATTDHAAAIARLKAAATAHSELTADGIASTMVTGISTAAANHRDTHGYRVCDSTRYPIFASARSAIKSSSSSSSTAAASNRQGVSSSRDENDDNENENDDDDMDVDDDDNAAGDATADNTTGDDKKATAAAAAAAAATAVDNETKSEMDDSTLSTSENMYVINDDPKSIWTAEEDLRLLDAIKTHGLGNWGDIAEAIGGNGSVGKTPRRCMERYFDDFLGRYGHILPAYTIVDDSGDDDNNNNNNSSNSNNNDDPVEGEDDAVRASKRRHALMMRSTSNLSNASSMGARSRKRFKVVPTESLPQYSSLWPSPYMPPIQGAKMGQEVARDLATKAEQAFVKAISAAPTKEEAEKIRQDYLATKMNQIGSPTVLPPRPEDSEGLPGADLVGFMPRRGDFDIEWENEAETALADMEFLPGDSPQDKELKIQVLEIYYQKQEEREKRKKFILSRHLFDYRQRVKEEAELPADERDLIHRMRLFERFHTPEEHKQFINDIIKAKRLRKEIAKLQMYRRIGIRSLAEAEMYELDKKRRQFHKEAQLQKDATTGGASTAASAGGGGGASGAKSSGTTPAASGAKPGTTPGAVQSDGDTSTTNAATGTPGSKDHIKESLWKQYRTTDRKVRRSINRAGSNVSDKGKTDDEGVAGDGGAKPEPSAGKDGDATKTTTDKDKAADDTKPSDTKPAENDKDTSKSAEAATTPNEADKDKKADDKVDVDDKDNDNKNNNNNTNNTDENNDNNTDENNNFDITKSKGYDLLSRREVALCVRLEILPLQYLEIKKALIMESLNNGVLESGNGRRTVVKIDIEKRGNILDFMVQAGWISSKLAATASKVQAEATSE